MGSLVPTPKRTAEKRARPAEASWRSMLRRLANRVCYLPPDSLLHRGKAKL